MQPPYNTPMVTALNRDDQFYVAQSGNRRMAKIAHVLAICEGSASPGTPGAPGLSAYQVARQEGYGGTQTQWVVSLQGTPGLSAYEIARQAGYGGTQTQWLVSLKGDPGASVKGDKGDPGGKGDPGTPGKDASSLLGTITIGETILLAVTLAGIRRVAITTPTAWGVVAGQSLMAIPTAAVPAGYAVHDVIVTADNKISVAVSVPALALGAVYSIPCKLHRLYS